MDGELERIEKQIGVSLAAWGLSALAAGNVIRLAADSSPWRAFGRQTASWGAIDAAIAAVAHVRARRRDRPMDERDRIKLYRLLVLNAALDVGYVAVGAALLTRAEQVIAGWPRQHRYSAAELRGDGAAIIVQGAYLLVHDSVFAIRTR